MFRVIVTCKDEISTFIYYRSILEITRSKRGNTVIWFTGMKFSKLHDQLSIQQLLDEIVSFEIQKVERQLL